MTKHTHNTEQRVISAAENCSRGSGSSDDSNLSSSEESSESVAAIVAGVGVGGGGGGGGVGTGGIGGIGGSTSEEEDDVLRNSPERMMALSIHHQIHPKLHQLVDRILADYDKLKSIPFLFTNSID